MVSNTVVHMDKLARDTGLIEQNMPAAVDAELQKRIVRWVSRRGYSYRSLAERIQEFVECQHRPLLLSGIDKLIVDASVVLHSPSKSYINNYAKGRPICFRYTNTLANFFDLPYSISNFNPGEDLLLKERLDKKAGL